MKKKGNSVKGAPKQTPQPLIGYQEILPWQRWMMISFLAVSFILRMITLYNFSNVPDITTDGTFYRQVAHEIISGTYFQQKRIFTYSPIYPLFVAGIYMVSGEHIQAVRFVQHMMGLASCLILFLLCRRLFSRRIALISFGLACFYIPFMFFETQILSITLVTFSMLLSVYLFVNALQGKKRDKSLTSEDKNEKVLDVRRLALMGVSGLFLGISVLGAPNTLVIFPAIVLWYLLVKRGQNWIKKAALNFGIFFAGLVLALAPFTIINYWGSGELIPVSTQGGITFYVGNNPNAKGYFVAPPGFDDSMQGMNMGDVKSVAERETGRSMTYGQVSSYWFNKGLNFILSNPGDFIGQSINKAFLFVNRYELPLDVDMYFLRQFSFTLSLPVVSYGIISVLGILGLIFCLRKAKENSLILLIFGVFSLTIIMFIINARYRLPAVPWFIILSGIAVSQIYDWYKDKKYSPLFGSALGVIITAIIVFFPLDFKASPASAYFNFGLYYKDHKDYKKAEIWFSKAAIEDPQWLETHYFLAEALYYQGKTEDALKEINGMLKTSGNIAEIHLLLGKIYHDKKMDSEAWKEMLTSLRLNPGLSSDPALFQQVLKSAKPEIYGIESGGTGITGPLKNQLQSLARRSQQEMNNKEFDKAIDSLNEYLLFVPRDETALLNLAKCYLPFQQYNNALTVLKRLEGVNPENKAVHKELGLIYSFFIKDNTEAVYHIKKHLELNPNDPQRQIMEKTLAQLSGIPAHH